MAEAVEVPVDAEPTPTLTPEEPAPAQEKKMPEVTKEELLKSYSGKVDPQNWGRPGHLTNEEVDCFFKFKAEVDKRGGEFRASVFSFGEVEGEAQAYCRWLRARKFDFEKVVAMIEEATEVRKEALAENFYPDPKDALGVDPSIYISQFPQLYTGYAKTGAPLFISKPGSLDVDGIECITTLDNILKYHWYAMMHDFKDRLQAKKEKEGDDFTRFECVIVLDLEKLTMGKLNSRTLRIIKVQSEIDSICFPETLGRMIIVNAPRYFSATWAVIKSWLDPRTTGKVDVISGRSSWEKKLLEYVDKDQLPSDYGGTGDATSKTLINQAPGGMVRLVTELLSFRSHDSCVIEIGAEEAAEITVYTQLSTESATFVVKDGEKNSTKADYVGDVKVPGESDAPASTPTPTLITKSRIDGPAKLKVKGTTSGSKKTYLVVCGLYPK
mmetsp:Transcript_19567/g.29707  ORF Transcript_19567/g.29707 Transcript_19567/m.29707 type:complete len:440 (-) Transcript_19567:258-1577(-)|eukprot:CAMPEP_0118688858 /NCGR_PEP_ID=MMETSP0800-20121206/9152_1 /TAXON_ID=210618 ORGANISM="Striatella unipunctata, Strain CCMP2910" /NCGR_SAMPLE_ID=MMETSP0800 /ASSEMBLY_ACC=CAM_ASM_000638 /LENGTH=439 /DNA_ID=CAMNT_0006586161 /DNA_START=17 /DNA_END=1336 /DNA_ORIENTATION=+